MAKRTTTAVWHDKHQRWQINVQKDSKRRGFYSSTPGKKGQRECHAKADAWLDDNIEDQNKKVEDLYDAFIDGLKKTTSKSHWFKYESFGKNWIKPVIGNKKIGQLTEQDIQDIIDKAFDKGRLSRKTLQNIRACLAAFIKFCRKKNTTKLIIEDVNIPSLAKKLDKHILQPHEMLILFKSNKTSLRGKEVTDRFINAYRFQVLTGLRPGELMGLIDKEDIKGNILTVNRSINVYNEITSGKNQNARRRFALTQKAMEVLNAQRALDLNSEYLFGDMHLSTYEKRWNVYCEYNKIPHTTLYELRHTFVSIAKKLKEGQLKPIIGHSEDMDTFGTYGHEVEGELQDTADDLNDLFQDILVNRSKIVPIAKFR